MRHLRPAWRGRRLLQLGERSAGSRGWHATTAFAPCLGYNPFGRIPKLALQHIAAAALITFQTALPGAHRSAQTLFHRQATQPGWTGCLPHRRHHPGKDLAPFNFFYAQVGAVKGSFVASFRGETSRVQGSTECVRMVGTRAFALGCQQLANK